MDKRWTAIVCAAFALAAVWGCGGGGTGGGSGAGGGRVITPEQRTAALNAVTAFYGTLAHTDRAADSQALAAYLQTRSEFAASGVSDRGSAWGRFTDGRLFVFANNRAPSPPEALRSADAAAARTGGRSALPTSRKAYVIHAMGAGFGNASSEIAFQLGSRGYDVISDTGSLATLREGIKQAGVLYMDSHGDECVAADGTDVYAIGTSEKVTPQSEATYKADLDAGHLVYFAADWSFGPDGKGVAETHYGITKTFVQTYIDVVPNSLVYIDACQSFDLPMIRAFIAKGATIYFGWDNNAGDAGAVRAARYFFDRALGTSIVDPVLDPPQRPFDFVSVYKDMVNRGLTTAVGTLRYWTADTANDVDLLAPTIARLAPDETHDGLAIAGAFGQDPGGDGKVTVGGTPLHVRSWTKDVITCDLPLSGAGSAGDVVVEVRGHKSNVVQLTEWRPTFTFTFHNLGTMQYTMTVHAHFRADVHSYRLVPGETPREGQWPFELAKDSTATVDASGSYTDPNGARFALQRNGSPDVPLNGDASRTFEGSGSIDTAPVGQARTLHLDLSGRVADALLTTVTTPDGTTYTALDEISFSTASLTNDGHSEFTMAFNDGWEIDGGTHIEGPLELDWPMGPPTYPPDPKAARSARLPR